MSSNSGFLAKAHFVPMAAGGIYFLFLAALMTPYLQKHFIFLHKVPFPFNTNFTNPERYGLAPHKTRNFYLTTSDGVKLGAWHVLPDDYYQTALSARSDRLPGSDPFNNQVFDDAIKSRPTIIYFHGNAASRAAPFRISTYQALSNRLNVNVVAVDYRGFADSNGVPSEKGLVRDAHAAWDWVLARREGTIDEKTSGISIMAQSLGTGVAAQLGRELAEKGTSPAALVLVAPYASLRTLLMGYKLAGFLPVLGPLRSIPYSYQFLTRFLYTHFDTSAALPSLISAFISGPTTVASGRAPHLILVHAKDDDVIPFSHSDNLFEGLVDTALGSSLDERPTTSSADAAKDEATALAKYGAHRRGLRSKLVKERTVDGFATILDFSFARTDASAAAGESDEQGSVMFVRTVHGGHNRVGEGVIDLIGDVLNIGRVKWQGTVRA